MENQIVLSMTSVLTIVGGLGLILGWFYKLLSKKFDKIEFDIREVREKLTAFEKNTEHRLTVLEMEAKNTNQRLSTIEGFLLPIKVLPFEEPPHDPDEPKEN